MEENQEEKIDTDRTYVNMEAADNQSRKRARDGDDDDDDAEILKGKKHDTISMSYPDESPYEYEFHDGIRVFDFPWLKEAEGVAFSSAVEDDDNLDEKFEPSSYLEYSSLDEIQPSPTHNPKQNRLPPSEAAAAVDGKNNSGGGGDDDGFWSLVVDDLEPLDCIWSCVIDKVLDVGFNKGSMKHDLNNKLL